MRSDSIIIEPDAPALARRAAQWLIERLTQAEAPVRSLVLAGGATPLAAYQWLAEPAQIQRIDWTRLHIFWGDERCVPRTDADSNYGTAWQAWLRHAPIAPGNLHPMPVFGTPQEDARAYDRELRAFHAFHRTAGQALFDVVLLGLGTDGHTASLFPGASPTPANDAWAQATLAPDGKPRITLTPAVLCDAGALGFLVSGAAKRKVVQRAISGDASLPATRIQPSGDRYWLLDTHAAAALNPPDRDAH